jgi:DNA-binding NarL/FixJ family response regulator
MNIKAFIVEDNPVIRENLIAALEELAPVHVVGSAADEFTAVDWLRNSARACDVVIIDIFLKGGSGLGVLRAMSERRPRLVVLSNYVTPEMRQRCMELGACQVFDKSSDVDALLSYCTRLAGGETEFGAIAAPA